MSDLTATVIGSTQAPPWWRRFAAQRPDGLSIGNATLWAALWFVIRERGSVLQYSWPLGWDIVHYDFEREGYTLERRRPFFKGRYRVVTAEQLLRGDPR